MEPPIRCEPRSHPPSRPRSRPGSRLRRRLPGASTTPSGRRSRVSRSHSRVSSTSTSQTPSGAVAGELTGDINYIRNSVKAVVNAYTGAVTLYQWGPADPMLQTWMKAFPGVIKPSRDIPSYLRPHLRYPPDLFEVQRQILAKYHVQNPQSFYGGQNFWTVPDDPSRSNPTGASQPPYYLTLSSMPGYRHPEFSLVTSFNPRGRPNMG